MSESNKNPEDMTDEEALRALEGLSSTSPASEEKKEEEEDSNVSSEPDDDEDSPEESEDGPEGESAEERAERRRQERRERNERRKRAREDRVRREREKDEEIRKLREQVQNLTSNVGSVMQGHVRTQIDALNTRFESEKAAFQKAEKEIADAVRLNDGARMTRAMAERDAAVERAKGIVAARDNLVASIRRQSESGQNNRGREDIRREAPGEPASDTSTLHPDAQRQAAQWMKKNPWFNSSGNETDTRVIAAIDQQLADEGFDPRDSSYWFTLEERAKRYLPHRYKNSGAKRSGPPSAGAGTDSGSSRSDTTGLSAERVAILKEIGVWDDPKKRKEYIDEYRRYDANSGRR